MIFIAALLGNHLELVQILPVWIEGLALQDLEVMPAKE
jgi:hypothetical protein